MICKNYMYMSYVLCLFEQIEIVATQWLLIIFLKYYSFI